MKTRYADMPRWMAWATVLLITASVFFSIHAATVPSARVRSTPSDDKVLYEKVTAMVAEGQDYYVAARAEHRALGYPMRPALVYREPTLSWLLAALRFDLARRAVIIALAALTAILFRERLDKTSVPQPLRLVTTLAFASGLFIVGAGQSYYLHEVWAAALIALSISMYSPPRWSASVIIGFVACLFRELAAPYLFVMFAFALLERKRSEAIAWGAALCAFAVLFSVHLHFAQALMDGTEPASRGWLAFGGWAQVLATARRNLLLYLLPAPALGFVVCAGLLGLWGIRDSWVSRIAVTATGYVLAMAVVGRPNNAYWGILYAPLLSTGFAFAPWALLDLAQNSWRGPAVATSAH